MARITVEDCLEKVGNRFALVLLVAKRAKQLLKGDQPTIPTKDNKYIVTSLREVAGGTVYYETERSLDEEVEADLNRNL